MPAADTDYKDLHGVQENDVSLLLPTQIHSRSRICDNIFYHNQDMNGMFEYILPFQQNFQVEIHLTSDFIVNNVLFCSKDSQLFQGYI